MRSTLPNAHHPCRFGTPSTEAPGRRPDHISISGRSLEPSPVFDTYWRFAATRLAIYRARLSGAPPPWTDDEVLMAHRFTNVFRAADRVSQYLICNVQRQSQLEMEFSDQLFRTLLFKIFNREETWNRLEAMVGPITWRTYSYEAFRAALDALSADGPIYSAAYVMPPPRLGEDRKHANHLRLLERMMKDGLAGTVLSSTRLEQLYQALVSYPGVGPFLAFQYAIDINYLDQVCHDEDQFVVAGPGAKDGIRKCFGRAATGVESAVIKYMVDSQEEHFSRLGLSFDGLFGRRLHLIDAQNLFCEVDKYSRVAHPEIEGISGRMRIKQKYRPAGPLPAPRFPSAWSLSPTPLG